ncbi:SIMPL domain-containing protein [Herminiimonas sp.]|uniref:SIMPL domain-containing protein n=1 Tax=Herminiimonas sp. TaxID=1926289 RepID=UPI0027215CFA|nr:SIMPL domain-containing protein [Herminiimonas sp.]MDO8305134.1 SIMPL domain-containing protein [Herminiimonas sp.]
MSRIKSAFITLTCLVVSASAFAQAQIPSSGTLVIVPAFGEVRQANDQAVLTLMVEEQDKDKAVAASRVNQKMKQGMDIVRKADAQAILTTRGYYTYPVYPEEQQRPANKARQPSSWRVGQYLEVKTSNLAGLPKTVAAAQSVLALSALQFGLADATAKKLDALRIADTYRNLTERIASIAHAMGRNPADAVLDTIDFEGSGNYAQEAASPKMMRAAMSADAAPVEEPSFEPGETTLSMRAVGKVRFR